MSVGMIAAGVSAVGAISNMGAAGDAADAQIGASREASALQEAARVQQREDLMPWTSGGNLAQNELLRRLGLSGAPAATGAAPAESRDQIRNRLLSQYTTAGGMETTPPPGLPGNQVRSYVNGVPGWSYGSDENAGFIADTAPRQGSSTVDEAGLNAAIEAELARTQTGANDGQYGSLLKQFDQNDLNNDLVYQNGLQFGLDNGNAAINQRAAASGGYGSGAALKALTKFGNDYATTKTAGAYDRNAADKARTFGMLQGVSSQGQSAAAGVGAAGINTANAQAGNINAAGNAAAAGSIAQGNALNQGIGGVTNAFQWNQLLNQGRGTGNVNVGTASYTPDTMSYFYGG